MVADQEENHEELRQGDFPERLAQLKHNGRPKDCLYGGDAHIND